MNYVQHHGIKGQKWGVRRFQNTDGSLTAEGKKRYSSGDYEGALHKVNTAGKAVDEVKKYKASHQKKNDSDTERRIRKGIAEMSDVELQKRVQRLNMEDNYTRMMLHRENLKKGESFVNKSLDVSTTVIQGATTALTIALLIKQLKK